MKHARNSKQEQSTSGQRWEEVFGTIACVTVQEWVAHSWSVAELQEARAAPYLFQSSGLTKWNTSTEHHDDTWKGTETFRGGRDEQNAPSTEPVVSCGLRLDEEGRTEVICFFIIDI